MKKSRLLLLILLLVSGWLVLPSHLQAQTDTSFNIITSPLPIALSGTPGSTLQADIRVKNGSTHPETLKVNLMKFGAYGEEGKPSIQDRAPSDDYFDWVKLSPLTFDAPPDQWQTVKLSIVLPKTAAFGYYYAVVFSRANNPTPNAKENVLIGSTAVLVLVDAKVPGAKRSASILSFNADKRFYEFLPTTFSLKLHNSGNIHFVPHGNIFISRGKKQVANLEFNSQQGNVLPNTNRIFTTAWKDGFPVYVNREQGGKVVLDKNGQPIRDLKWDLSKVPKLKFGHYTAKLVAVYDDGTRDVPLEATVSFWVVPWRLVGGALLVSIFAGFGVWSMGSKVWRKFKKRRS